MQTDSGWLKLYRKMLNNPVVWKTPVHTSVWNFIMLSATHEEMQATFGGKKITLLPGQLLTSYQKIANHIHSSKLKVQRAIIDMRNDTQIDTRTDRQQSLITIRNWSVYQYANDTRNDTRIDTQMIHEARKKDEKEKSSKKEKEENKEPYKNERSSNAHARENDCDSSSIIHLFGWRNTRVLMLSDEQFESICEHCGLDEIDYYMDRMVELINKGYTFGCSHYEYIMSMVEKDRRVRA